MPGWHIDLEQIRKVDRGSRSYCTEVKRRTLVLDSSTDWKSVAVQSVKMVCGVVWPRSFQDEASCSVLNLLKSV